jgi:DNA-binding response OmpR family regulator
MSLGHVLAVDDEPGQLSSLKRILRRSGIELETAASGRLGLQMALHNPPDLILLDISMPLMSGLEFARRLRRLEAKGRIRRPNDLRADGLPHIPIVFLTALGAPHQRVSGLDAGAVDYITKPFDADELRARVRRQLRRVQQERELAQAAASEQARLAHAIEEMQRASRTCSSVLLDLNTNLELAGLVRSNGTQSHILTRAKADVGSLTQALLRIAYSPPTKEVIA